MELLFQPVFRKSPPGLLEEGEEERVPSASTVMEPQPGWGCSGREAARWLVWEPRHCLPQFPLWDEEKRRRKGHLGWTEEIVSPSEPYCCARPRSCTYAAQGAGGIAPGGDAQSERAGHNALCPPVAWPCQHLPSCPPWRGEDLPDAGAEAAWPAEMRGIPWPGRGLQPRRDRKKRPFQIPQKFPSPACARGRTLEPLSPR